MENDPYTTICPDCEGLGKPTINEVASFAGEIRSRTSKSKEDCKRCKGIGRIDSRVELAALNAKIRLFNILGIALILIGIAPGSILLYLTISGPIYSGDLIFSLFFGGIFIGGLLATFGGVLLYEAAKLVPKADELTKFIEITKSKEP